MATFVQRLLPSAPDDEMPVAIRLVSGLQARTSVPTPIDARDTDRNSSSACSGHHRPAPAQFRHWHRPLAEAVEYAKLFIYDETQQESALSDVTILGGLPRKCLLMRLGDPKQTSEGTGPDDLARRVRYVSDHLALGIRSMRCPCLRQALSELIQSLLIDGLPPEPARLCHSPAWCAAGPAGDPPRGGKPAHEALWAPTAARATIAHALLHVVDDEPLRWHVANDIDACAGVRVPHDWCIMLPLSQRVQAGVYTLTALSRYRETFVRQCPPERPLVLPATACCISCENHTGV